MALASPALRRRRPSLETAPLAPLLPVAVSVAAALIWLIVAPASGDLAAQLYRVHLFAVHGFSVWDQGWYAGHHTLGYSVLFPPLADALGTRVTGAVSAVAATIAFTALVRHHFGTSALLGSVWFGAATATELLSGRMTFIFGVAVGLAALVALQRGLTALAVLLAVATALSSPVAALFLALAGVAYALAGRGARRGAAAVAAAALLSTAFLALAFPEGGYEPFLLRSMLALVALSLLAAAVLPRPERVLRAGAVLYALAGIAAYAIHTPMGSNVTRLGPLVGGPLLACALPRWPRGTLARAGAAAVTAAFLWWQWGAAVSDVRALHGDPGAELSFYRPLVSELARLGGPPGRVEIPFTKAHLESYAVATRFPLARGWERQLDVSRDAIFYTRGALTPASYERWLAERAVRFVAVPDTRLDASGIAEAALVRRGLSYLRLRWRSAHWRLYEVTRPGPVVVPSGAARMRAVSLDPGGVTIAVMRSGHARIAVAWSPYWRLRGGCVERDGDWTVVTARRAGRIRLEISFSLKRVLHRGPRCG